MASSQTHQVVIVGANFSGVNVAHYLLRQTFPALQKLLPNTSYRVTLISPNTHFFFKIAAPRALLNPDAIPEDKYFRSIQDAFKQYDASIFSFVHGKAVGLDPQDRSVSVQMSSESQERTFKYDSLVIASGTLTTSPLWTLHGSHETSRAALKAMHDALPKASSVLIVGAGPVGVETAGEITSTYPKAKVTLATSSDRVLPSQPPNLSAKAKQCLEQLGVTVKINARLEDPSVDENVRPVKLSDGSSETPDVFINATGPSKMNTEWLPTEWLDGDRRVATRDTWFRVKGEAASVQGVYVVGDLVSGSRKTAIENDAMIPVVGSSICVDILKAGGQKPASGGGYLSRLNPLAKAPVTQQADYKPMKDTIFVPVGPNGGVGQVFGWSVPSLMVKKGKAERFLVELVEPQVTGSKWA